MTRPSETVTQQGDVEIKDYNVHITALLGAYCEDKCELGQERAMKFTKHYANVSWYN